MGTIALNLLKSKWTYYVILTIFVLSLYVQNQKAKEEVSRLNQNQTALLQKNEEYKTLSGKSAKEVQKLNLTVKEVKESKTDLLLKLADLQIKLNRLVSASTTSTETTIPINAQIKDSIVYREGKTDTLRCINLKSPYYSVTGCENNGMFSGLIIVPDSIIQVAHRVPHRFLFFKWGTKAIRQEVTSTNPFTKIIFSEYLEIKK
ncbi:MAG: hypothetical protein NTZ69_16115 [Bacteroidia bacterium]|nr:hypothetical protein [Bacteroidia bacterium]